MNKSNVKAKSAVATGPKGALASSPDSSVWPLPPAARARSTGSVVFCPKCKRHTIHKETK